MPQLYDSPLKKKKQPSQSSLESKKGGAVPAVEPPKLTPQPLDTFTKARESFAAPEPPKTRRELAEKLVAKQLKEQNAPTFVDPYGNIKNRTTTLQQDAIYSNPHFAAQLVLSTLPEEKLAEIEYAATRTFEWLKDRDRFAGLPGGILKARVKALGIGDPELRAEALALLDTMQSLPEADQQQLYANLLHGDTNYTFEQMEKTIQELIPGAEMVFNIGREGAQGTIDIEADSETRARRVQLLQALFPNTGIQMADPKSFADMVGESLDNAFEWSYDESILSNVLDIGEAGILSLSYPFEAGGGVLSDISQYVPGGENARRFTGSAIRGGFNALNKITMPIAGTAARAATIGAPEAERDRATEVANGLLQLFLLHEAGKVTSAFKISREMPAEVSAGRLGIVLEKGAVTNPKIFSIKQSVWKYFNKPMESWFKNTGGRRFLAEVERLRAKDPEHLSGNLALVYGEQLPAKLRMIIAETPKELVPEAISRYFRNPGGPDVATKLFDQAREKGKQAESLEASAVMDIPTPEPIRGAGQIREYGTDTTQYGYHASPIENHASIAETGIKANQPKLRGPEATGVYLTERPYDYPFIEDAPKALYRVRLDQLSEIQRFSEADIMTPQNIPAQLLEVYTGEGRWAPVKAGEGKAIEASRLRLEQYTILKDAELALEKRPLIQYPRKNIFRAALRSPTTRTERVLGYMFSPRAGEKRLYDAAKAVDELPRTPVLFGPGEASPLNWRETTADSSIKYMRRAGVPDPVVAKWIAELDKVKVGQDFFEWAKVGADLINRHLPKNTPRDTRIALTRWWDNPIEARSEYYTTPSKPGAPGEAVVPGIDGAAMPDSPTAFTSKVTLPDVDLTIEATSAMRRAARAIPGGQFANNAIRTILRIGTSTLKAPILVLRLPALITRIQMEQMVRMTEYGGAEGFWPGGTILRRRKLTKGFEAPAPEDLGSMIRLHEEISYEVPSQAITRSTGSIKRGTELAEPQHYTAWARSIQHLSTDWFNAQFARVGLDVDAMINWISTSSKAKFYLEREQLPVLRRSPLYQGLDDASIMRLFLERKADAIGQLTGGSPDLVRTISSGTWRREPTIKTRSTALAEEYATLTTRREGIKANIKEQVDVSREGLAAMQAELGRTRARQIAIEDELGGRPRGRTVDLDSERAMANELKRSWEAGEIEMPDTLTLRTAGEDPAGSGIAGGLRKIERGWNQAWYAAFRPASWADIKGTRGSLFYQIAGRERAVLRNMGWSEKSATAHAEVTAAARVADIMYDLSARTSLHRSLKDVFWFAPAQMEVLYTWLVKIPSRYYPGIGHALLAAKGATVLDMLRDVGVIQKDTYGDEVITIPGLEPLLNITGVADIKSFNLITSNGLLPGLSTLPSVALSEAALNYGGVWKELTDVFLPYGPNLNVFPRSVVYAMELAGAHFEPFDKISSALFGDSWERAKDRAYQIAASELEKQGIVPPRAEDFGDVDTDPEARDKYRAALADYRERLDAEQEGYLTSQTFVSLLGASIFPASIQVSTDTRDAWLKHRNDVIDKRVGEPQGPDGEYTEAQWELRRELTDAYVAEHPGAFPYTVSYYEPADEARYPKYVNAGDDLEFDQLYAQGLVPVLKPDEYIKKMLMLESMRHYSGMRDQALRDISPTLDPVELLLNWNERSKVLDKIFTEQENYFALNPEAQAYYDKHRMDLHDKYGIPVNTIQADRLAESARLLRMVSRQDEGLDPYDMDQVAGASRVLSSMYSEQGIFGEPNTPTEEALAHFWEDIYGPYRERRAVWYDRAARLQEAGLDSQAAEIYEKIRRFDNEQKERTFGGVTFPTPERVRWGMLNKQDRKDAITKWATRPTEWLTDFQIDKVYGDSLDFKGREGYIRKQAELEEEVANYILEKDVSYSSSEYDWLMKWKAQRAQAIANEYGPAAQRMLTLSDATPIVRLETAGLVENGFLKKVGRVADAITQRLVKDELSPRGFSGEALFYKEWMYKLIEDRRKKNKGFDAALDDLSLIFAESGDTYKTGVPLYEALFFGNFNTEFIPDELVTIGKV